MANSLHTNMEKPAQGIRLQGAFPANYAQYRYTFLFVAAYFMISHGRIHLFIPALSLIPSAMITGILAVVSFFVENIRCREKIYLIREERLVLGLVLLCFFTLPTSVWVGGSVSVLIRGFLPTSILMFISIMLCRKESDVRKFVWLYMINCSLIILLALKVDLDHYSKGVTDTYDVNDIAMVLCVSLPIMFFFMTKNKGFKKILIALFLVLSIVTIVRTESRGGILGILSIVVYLIINSQEKLKYLLISCVMLASLFSFAPDSAKERFMSMYDPQTEYDQSLGNRTQIWNRGVKLFFSSPILGVGFSNFSVADGNATGEGGWKTAHNSFLLIAVELGIVGFVLFVKLTVGTFLRIRRFRKAQEIIDSETNMLWLIKGLEVSFLVYMVTASFLSASYNPQFYFIVSLFVISQKLIKNKKYQQNTNQVVKYDSL